MDICLMVCRVDFMGLNGINPLKLQEELNMTTVVILIGILVYAGPCALFYLLGKQQGYNQGLAAGTQMSANQQQNNGWNPRV